MKKQRHLKRQNQEKFYSRTWVLKGNLRLTCYKKRRTMLKTAKVVSKRNSVEVTQHFISFSYIPTFLSNFYSKTFFSSGRYYICVSLSDDTIK